MPLLRRLLSVALLIALSFSGTARAQVAGLNTLSLLQLPSSARTASLGVDYLSIFSPEDLNVGVGNPSFVNASYDQRLAINYVGFFSGSNSGSVAYGRDFHGFGSFLFGLDFNSYGIFQGFDEEENDEGSFYAADIALMVAWGLAVDSNFSIGASLKPVWSQYESYSALAVALSVAGSYVSDDKRFAATLQARNIGAQLMTFDGTVEKIPFDLSVAMSYKVSNAPFRVYAALNELTRWRLGYDDSLNPEVTIDPYTGQPVEKYWYDGIAEALDYAARHVALGVELDINKVFFARIGYRYRQNIEMSAQSRTNINVSGFSYGFGLHTKKFEFAFARRNYHLGQAPTYLSLSFKW